MRTGWIGVDLDGVLAVYDGWRGPEHIGEPIPKMVDMVRNMIKDGYEVRIFTARACIPSQIPPIKRWLVEVAKLPDLKVTCSKDIGMEMLYDDRCVQMIPNTGIPVVDLVPPHALEKYLTKESSTANRDVYTEEYIKNAQTKRGKD